MFSLNEAMNLLRVGKSTEAVEMVNKAIESLQPNSPQIQLIAQQLGIDIEFFKPIMFSDFADPDPQIQTMRFKYYAYKVAKWGQQILQQKRKVKRRHDLIQQPLSAGSFHKDSDLQSELQKVYGRDAQSQLMIDSRLQSIQDKTHKRNKVHQKILIQELEIERKRVEYNQKQEEKQEKLRRTLHSEFALKLEPVQAHLAKVNEKIIEYKEAQKTQNNQLIAKRQEWLKNADEMDVKLKTLEQRKELEQDRQKSQRLEKKQRQHSLQELNNHLQEEYIQNLKRQLEDKANREFRRIGDVIDTNDGRVIFQEWRQQPSPVHHDVYDKYEQDLNSLVAKNLRQQPIMNSVIANAIETAQNKKLAEQEKLQKIVDNRSQIGSFRSHDNLARVQGVTLKRSQLIKSSVSLRREISKQRFMNFEQNRQQIQVLQSHQIERYNEYNSRRSDRLRNRKHTNDMVKQNVNQALLSANRIEQHASQLMNKAVKLISDPDLHMVIATKEKLTTHQQIAKKKQEEMSTLLKSFVNEKEFAFFSKTLTESNKLDELPG